MKKFLYRFEYAGGTLSLADNAEMTAEEAWQRATLMGLEKGRGTPLAASVQVAVEKPIPRPRGGVLVSVNREWWDNLPPAQRLTGGDGQKYVFSAGEAVPVSVESAAAVGVEAA